MKKVLTVGATILVVGLLYMFGSQYLSSTKKGGDVIVPRPGTGYENTGTIVKQGTVDGIPTS